MTRRALQRAYVAAVCRAAAAETASGWTPEVSLPTTQALHALRLAKRAAQDPTTQALLTVAIGTVSFIIERGEAAVAHAHAEVERLRQELDRTP